MSNKKFYISDLHLGHMNCIRFDNRPFQSLEEMEYVIVNNWNKAVSPNDIVYVLGDMFWNNNDAVRILPTLNGEKHLILGNHDRINAQMEKHFKTIKELDIIKDENRHIVLCHYPIAHWRNADHGYIHLYGHIHNGRDNRPFTEYMEQMKQRGFSYECYNVGCMMPYMNYTPRTLDEIIERSK